ncbi:hypothetical protein NE237_023958 [Protea cynaroides]|uniref:RFTS domain-containing protein n=1 Tax=Protea cynaroides TaxID=273540 RepID=A0A9Q0HDS9_9MAGN|nr:hypothetical protein NE237_023958 [Protea cynaroides]
MIRARPKSSSFNVHKIDSDKAVGNDLKEKKRNVSRSNESAESLKMPKRAAVTYFKERDARFVHMTSGAHDARPNRKLTDFSTHDAARNPLPFEMIEVDEMFISGTILPPEGSSDKDTDKDDNVVGRVDSDVRGNPNRHSYKERPRGMEIGDQWKEWSTMEEVMLVAVFVTGDAPEIFAPKIFSGAGRELSPTSV